MRDWTQNRREEKELSEAIVPELLTADFSRVSAAIKLYQERIQDSTASEVTRAFEYAVAQLFLKWLNGNEVEGIRGIVSLVSAIRLAVPQSQIVTALYALSLFEQGDLRIAEREFLALPSPRELPPLIEDLCTKALQQIDEAKVLNVGKPATEHLLLLDSAFPSKSSSFRYAEFSNYLSHIESSSYWARPDQNMFNGEPSAFLNQIKGYVIESGIAANRVRRFDSTDIHRVKVAYCVFLNAADIFFSQIGIPSAEHFIFTLYPGGGFALHDERSDAKLRNLCDNPKLAKIITTQKKTYEYLLEKGFCERERLEHIFGVPVPAAFNAGSRRRHGTQSEEPLKVCFVAHRYSTIGAEKGYDVFADVVRTLANSSEFHFHVVGDFDRSTVDLAGVENITFHGIQSAEFFPRFYSQMDAIVSPNIQMSEINPSCPAYFDGFPTTCVVEAGLQGVAMLTTDFLRMNQHLDGTAIFSSEELKIIDRSSASIADLLVSYVYDRPALARLGEAGRQALLREFSFEKQMLRRMEILNSYLQS